MTTTMPPSPSISYAYPMFSDYYYLNDYYDDDDGGGGADNDPLLLFTYTGLDTVCPGLLWPDAVPVPFLLSPRGLGRAPSPSPTMSSEDEPAVTTAMSHPPKPQPQPLQQHQPLSVPLSTTPLRSSDSNATPATSSDGARIKRILSSQKISDEPMSTATSEANSAMPTPNTMSGMASNGAHHPNSNRPSRWTKARSTSTESSMSLSGMTTLGSMYNQDGFPNYPASSDDDGDVARIAADDAAIAKQLALTDEAVRQINGTPSVVQARNLGNMMPNTPSANAYELPRSMAAFVHRQPTSGEDGRELKTGRSFVSSGSSTSSEESEHLASVQWVTSVSQPSNTNYNNYPFYYTGTNSNNGSSVAGTNNGQATSPKMPPPALTNTRKLNSPRRNGTGVRPGSSGSGPATPNATQPSGLPSSALPPGASGDTPVENEDDDQTIGGPNREGSPSSSSASGLDLLSHAAAHHERSRYSTYIKRKAGAEAVAQWRESGIPSGAARPDGQTYSNSPGYDSTPSDGQTQDNGGSSEPPKKRRRSEMQLETPEARLRNPPSNPSEQGSDYDSASASDSEYQSGKRGRRSSKGKHKIRVRATLPMPSSSSAGGGTPAAKEGSSPTAPKKQTAKPRRSSGTSEGKSGGLGPNGVQCEYVNPLPPYQRCPDVFTRKYDIPRHMARHARREGDLVAEGKLPEEKAMLWKTIRDKPRIRCKTCGEYFTRQDALKRHQTKQHH